MVRKKNRFQLLQNHEEEMNLLRFIIMRQPCLTLDPQGVSDWLHELLAAISCDRQNSLQRVYLFPICP